MSNTTTDPIPNWSKEGERSEFAPTPAQLYEAAFAASAPLAASVFTVAFTVWAATREGASRSSRVFSTALLALDVWSLARRRDQFERAGKLFQLARAASKDIDR